MAQTGWQQLMQIGWRPWGDLVGGEAGSDSWGWSLRCCLTSTESCQDTAGNMGLEVKRETGAGDVNWESQAHRWCLQP